MVIPAPLGSAHTPSLMPSMYLLPKSLVQSPEFKNESLQSSGSPDLSCRMVMRHQVAQEPTDPHGLSYILTHALKLVRMFKAESHCPAPLGLIVYVDERLAKGGLFK